LIIGAERRLAIVISTIVLIAGSASKAEQTQVKIVQSAVEAAVRQLN
jgi:hypothetical protein